MKSSTFIRTSASLIAIAFTGTVFISASCSSSTNNSNAGSGGSASGGSSSGGSGSGGNGSGGNGSGGNGSGGSASGGSGSGGANGLSCESSDSKVCFKDGQAQGPMTGVGWVALGMLDTLTDPTCDTDKHAIDSANACTTITNWSSGDALCISGMIPALPEMPFQSDYDNNWGIQIGVNSSEPPGVTVGKAYASIAITVAGNPSSGLRAELHVKGEPAGQTYCADLTSGQAIQLSAFNQECWNGDMADPSKALSTDNIQNIDKVGIQISSTQQDITVDNLCLQSIVFQ